MQRDGRSLDHGTLETIRLMAVERVREGERASSVISSYGFNRTTIYKWLAVVSSPGKGLNALRWRPVMAGQTHLKRLCEWLAPLSLRQLLSPKEILQEFANLRGWDLKAEVD